MRNLLNNVELRRVANAAAAGTSTITSSTEDTQGYGTATFVVALGDVTDTSEITVTVQHGDASDGSDAADTEANVSVTAGASDTDNEMLVAEVVRPRKRYVRATIARATANAVVDGAFLVLSNTEEVPVTQGDDVAASATFNDPAAA